MTLVTSRSLARLLMAALLSGVALLAAPAAHAADPEPVLAWNFNDAAHPGRDWVASVDLAPVHDAAVVARETGEGKDPAARASVLNLPGGETTDLLDGTEVAAALAAAGLPTSGSMSITLWVWVRNPGSLVSWGGSGGSYTFAISDNGLNVVEQWSAGSSHLHFTATPGLGYGWTHLAVTVDPAAEVQRKVYFNGGRVDWAMAGTPGWTTSIETFSIGGNGPGGWGPVPFAGLIDDVRIYDAALTQAQIETIMAETDEAKIPPAPPATATPTVRAVSHSYTVTTGERVAKDLRPELTFPGDAAITAATQPHHGSLVWGGDGTYTYTPEPGFVGTDSFTYTVCSAGVCDSATETFVVIAATQQAPSVARGVRAQTGDGDAMGALVVLGLFGLIGASAYGLRDALASGLLRPAPLPLALGLLAVRLLVWLWDLALTWLPSRD